MPDAVDAGIFTVLALYSVGRTNLLRGTTTQRAVWVAMAALAGAQATNVEPIRELIIGTAGRPDAATLAKKLLVLVGTFGAFRAVAEFKEHRGRPRGVYRYSGAVFATAAALIALPLLDPPTTGGVDTGVDFYTSTPASIVSWVAQLGVQVWVCGAFSRMCWEFSSPAKTPETDVRTGLVISAVGTTLAVGWAVIKAIAVLSMPVDLHAGGQAERISNTYFSGPALALVALGSAYPSLVRGLQARAARARDRVALRRLASLWLDLREAIPGIDLGVDRARPPREVLLHRVVEIRDGLLLVLPYVPARVIDKARREATARGLKGARHEWFVAASALEAGRRAMLAGRSAVEELPLPVGGGTDLRGEVRWLEGLAAAHRRARRVEAPLSEPPARTAPSSH